MDAYFGRDPEQVVRTNVFDLPLRRDRHGDYKLAPGSEVFTCLTSDFFLEEADPWRAEAWALMRARPDVQFSIITKRIVRLTDCLPADWGMAIPMLPWAPPWRTSARRTFACLICWRRPCSGVS